MKMWRGTTLSSVLHGSITLLLVAGIPILTFMPESSLKNLAPGSQETNRPNNPDPSEDGLATTAPRNAAPVAPVFPSAPTTRPRNDTAETSRPNEAAKPEEAARPEETPLAIEIVSIDDLPPSVQKALKKLPPIEQTTPKADTPTTPAEKKASADTPKNTETVTPDQNPSRSETVTADTKTPKTETRQNEREPTSKPDTAQTPDKPGEAPARAAEKATTKPEDKGKSAPINKTPKETETKTEIAKLPNEEKRTVRAGTGGEFGAGGPGGTGTDGRGAKGSIERKPQKPLPPKTLDTGKRIKTVDELLERLAKVLPRIGRDAKLGAGGQVSATTRSRQVQNLERLLRAAKNGHPNAQYNVARMLIRGEGSEPDPEQARKWLQKSAERGYVRAQILMGYLSASGMPGNKKNLGDADFWWALAERKGSKPAAQARKLLRPKLTSKDILHSQRRQGEHRRLFDFLPKPFQALSAGGDGVNDDLREAASAGNTKSLLDALLKGADVDGQDIDGKTAMINAEWRGRKQIIKILLEQGADLEVADNRGRSPVMWSAINGHGQVVEELLQAGSEFDQPDDEGLTPLMRAAWNGHTAIVNILLLEGADPERRDFNGKTALDHAKREKHPDIIARLEPISP